MAKTARKKEIVVDKKTLLPFTYYAAGSTFWVASTEIEYDEAVKDISRKLNLDPKKFVVKTY